MTSKKAIFYALSKNTTKTTVTLGNLTNLVPALMSGFQADGRLLGPEGVGEEPEQVGVGLPLHWGRRHADINTVLNAG